MATNPSHPNPNSTDYGQQSSVKEKEKVTVGGFEIREEIGRGSFATVFLGLSDTTGARVAVKTVSRDKLNRKLAENLESEIRIMQEVRHQNIVRLLDIVKTDKHIHLIMAFCALGDLSQFIKKKGCIVPYGDPPNTQANPTLLASPWGGINEAIVRHFLAQLAAALETLRSLSLIHRDLKPQNLLLDPPPASAPPLTIASPYMNAPAFTVPALPILKLADFGFARALPQQSLASTLCGSPLYMAPEILRGDRYDAKVDLWSLGTILYEMMTGRPPYKAQNHIDLLRKIDKGEGWIKFPGDEDQPDRRKSILVGQPPPPAAPISSSLGRRVVANFPAASLGASPKFPSVGQPGMIGVRPISDDLKDLTRRLLKRNPMERMSFEEFFMHTAVVTGASNIDVGGGGRKLVDVETVPMSQQPQLQVSSTLTFSSSSATIHSQVPQTIQPSNTLATPTPTPPNMEIVAPKSTGTATGTAASNTTPKLGHREQSASPVNPLLPDPSSTPFPPMAKQTPFSSTPSTPSSKPANVYHYMPPPTSTQPPFTSSSPKDDIFGDLEPPFAGYDLDPQKVFGDLLVAAPLLSTQQQKHQHSSSPQKAPVGKSGLNIGKTVAEEDGSSSISSLGSLELSEEMEQELKGKKAAAVASKAKAAAAAAFASASAGTAAIASSSKKVSASTSKQQKRHDSNNSNTSPTRGLKSSFEDFEIIESDSSRPADVNWLDATGGISEAMQTHARAPISIQNQNNNHYQNHQHQQQQPHAGPFSKLTSIASGVSASPPASPFSKRVGGESLKGSRSFDRGIPVSSANAGTPANTTTAIVGSAGSGGTGGGFHEYGT
ncbi:UNVERIFIED_CONTAM: Serine/threonine-protein kinase, partial [Siphonaria sp. JEL0065]